MLGKLRQEDYCGFEVSLGLYSQTLSQEGKDKERKGLDWVHTPIVPATGNLTSTVSPRCYQQEPAVGPRPVIYHCRRLRQKGHRFKPSLDNSVT